MVHYFQSDSVVMKSFRAIICVSVEVMSYILDRTGRH
jgi:hypothetical protein